MSQSLPVVATPTGAEQYIDDEINGLLVPVGDAAACRDAVVRISSERALRTRLIENGLRTARDHTLERNAEEVRAAIQHAFPTLATRRAEEWHPWEPTSSSPGTEPTTSAEAARA